MRTGVIARNANIENCVQNLNLSSSDGILIINGDDLWRHHGPQTLSQEFDFFGRFVKVQAEGKTSLKRAVQQTLIEFTKPFVLDGGIEEYNFSHPVLSDTEEGKNNSNICESNQNPGSDPVATLGRGGRLRGTSKCSREVSTSNHTNQPPLAQRPRVNSRSCRRGFWGSTSRNESRRNSKSSSQRPSRSHNRSRERRWRSPPRKVQCCNCKQSVRASDRYCPNCALHVPKTGK